MSPLRRASQSGQALLIAVFIGLVLLAAIPVIIFVNMTGISHKVAATKRDKGAAIAEAGINYAIQLFNNAGSAAWDNIITSGSFAAFPDCNSNNDIVTADGGHFQLQCGALASDTCPKVGTPLVSTCEAYQVYVRATAFVPDPHGITDPPERTHPMLPFRATQAYLSRKTLTLTLPSGMSTPIGFQVFTGPWTIPVNNTSPIIAGPDLQIHNGPIAYYDALNTWTLQGSIDAYRYPRKYSKGAIVGNWCFGTCPAFPRSPAGTPPLTDSREYWAWSDLGFQGVIDVLTPVVGYSDLAAAQAGVPALTCTPSGNPLLATPPGSGRFIVAVGGCVAGDMALFDGPIPGYAWNQANGIIVVMGNARFRTMRVDVKGAGPNPPGGALVVLGDLHLDPNAWPRDGTEAAINKSWIRIPPGSGQEYAYSPAQQVGASTLAGGVCVRPPGAPSIGQNCQLWTAVDFRGFLYVTQNLIFEPQAAAGTILGSYLAGTLRVDGQITFNNPANQGMHYFFYDDQINRAIRTAQFGVQIDTQREVPVGP